MATIKYLRRENVDIDQNVMDLGGRILCEPPSIPVNLSLEYIARFTEDYTDNVSLLAEYVMSDNAVVYATIGKKFTDEELERHDLVTTLGITFGCGQRVVSYQ